MCFKPIIEEGTPRRGGKDQCRMLGRPGPDSGRTAPMGEGAHRNIEGGRGRVPHIRAPRTRLNAGRTQEQTQFFRSFSSRLECEQAHRVLIGPRVPDEKEACCHAELWQWIARRLASVSLTTTLLRPLQTRAVAIFRRSFSDFSDCRSQDHWENHQKPFSLRKTYYFNINPLG